MREPSNIGIKRKYGGKFEDSGEQTKTVLTLRVNMMGAKSCDASNSLQMYFPRLPTPAMAMISLLWSECPSSIAISKQQSGATIEVAPELILQGIDLRTLFHSTSKEQQ